MKVVISKPETNLNLTIALSGDEVRKELHKIIDDRYKEGHVIKSMIVVTSPVVDKKLGISFNVRIDLAPAIDELAQITEGRREEDDTPF